MESEPGSPINDQLGLSLPSPAEETASLPQSYAFTVHFDCDTKQRNTSVDLAAKFSRRHIRNLSLPISKIYENQVNNGSGLNGKVARKAGNHSEGYFSSDPEDESKPKLYEMKLKHDAKGVKSTNVAQEKRPVLAKPAAVEGAGEGEEASSDVASETGTYTIDKDSPEVTEARHSIDSVFGVLKTTEVTKSQSISEQSNHSTSATWINDWASSVVEHNSLSTNSGTNSSSSSRNSVTGVSVSGSKIPSPVNHRLRQPPLTQPMKGEHSESIRTTLLRKSYPTATPTQDMSPLETESYLRETERAVSALAARMSLSMDSGGESDAENSLGNTTDPTPSANTETTTTTTTRYNRAFSLRRGRLDEPKKKEPSVMPVKARVEPVVKAAVAPRVVKRDHPLPSPSTFARTDVGRFSMRVPRPLSQTPMTTMAKKEVVKKRSSTGGGSARSNSTLSSKEVDFQNWKRRAKYDPMKAAAEGKKKETAKKQPSGNMTQSTNSTITTPKSPVNPVLRSASFHGTRQLTASSSEEEEEITLSAEDEDWPVLPAPRSSREHTPQGSRLSLYSNNSNSPTPPLRNRPKLEVKKRVIVRVNDGEDNEGVDTLVISALSGLSSKLKGSSCSLLNKLRYLYDEDSPKNHQLGAMVDQLEASEPGSPQVKSPSRELATTLRNLKRLESMLKVLDEVLFDEEEFQKPDFMVTT